MSREVTEQSRAISAASLLTLAVGAAAFGAVAIGVLAIGRLAVGRLVIKKARFNELKVGDLTGEHRKIAQGRPAMMGRLALIILMLTLPLSATAQSVGGNPLIGRQAAATLCVPCHQIDETRRDGPPSFVDIALMPSTTYFFAQITTRCL